MAILVTRPQEKGKELCQWLNDAGIPAFQHVFMEYETGNDLIRLESALNWADTVIAVSQPAVTYSNTYLLQQQKTWPTNKQYVAVGQKTAQHLSKYTQLQVDYPHKGSDSEHLLTLPSLQKVENLNVLILRGDGGRELIAEELREKGANVKYCETYKRIFLTFNAEQKLLEWQSKHIDSIVFTSEALLSFFVSQFTAHDFSWLSNLKIWVPSKRIAVKAQQLGFNDVIITNSANNRDLMAALQPKVTGLTNDEQQYHATNPKR